ncbi:MAG: hypothetical protein HY040_15430 [Planctomycetes bacterium]|nr:hypothetical protein [Planctomycetota bacterium]
MKRTRLLPPLLLFLTLLAGCKSYTPPDCKGGIAALGDTTLQAVWRRDGLLVLVWSDISPKSPGFGSEGGSSSSHSGSVGRTEWNSTVKSNDGRSVQLKAATSDGINWTVAVNGTEYRLDDGAVFLVRTRGQAVKVIQVKQDISAMPPTHETWQRLPTENAEVQEFVKQAGE